MSAVSPSRIPSERPLWVEPIAVPVPPRVRTADSDVELESVAPAYDMEDEDALSPTPPLTLRQAMIWYAISGAIMAALGALIMVASRWHPG